MELVIATRNKHKVLEFKQMVSCLDVNVASLLDYLEIKDIEENGKTFEENAKIKVREVAKLVKDKWVLADDSGLVVDVLNGEPGIYSARFGGVQGDYTRNNKKLLELMMDVPKDKRAAHFVCVLVLRSPEGKETVVQGKCDGTIAFELSGSGGFGYDPIFYLPNKKCTMAELSSEEKNKISHRGVALKKLKKILEMEIG